MASQSESAAGVGAELGANGRHGVIDLARTAVEDTVHLVRLEIQLARQEVLEMVSANLRAALLLVLGGVCLFLGLIMLLVWIALAVPNHALAAAIELGVFVVLALILGGLGTRSLLRNIRALKKGPLPKTMTTLKEDAEWARHLLKRNGK